mmetsp:Transcript_44405/g.74052  ORF Transcript_44405/g.74052 Transcript_44405/m.74052 type:complete len:477 (+) Transcript_44405:146-1576(+)
MDAILMPRVVAEENRVATPLHSITMEGGSRSLKDSAQDLTTICGNAPAITLASFTKEDRPEETLWHYALPEEETLALLSFRLNAILDATPSASEGHACGTSQLTDHLFLGSAEDCASHGDLFDRLGITHVICLVEGEVKRKPGFDPRVLYLGFDCRPKPYDMRRVVSQVLDFYDEGMKSTGQKMKLMTHCVCGGNRGGFLSSVLVARELQVDIIDAVSLVFQKRPTVLRSPTFRKQILQMALGEFPPIEAFEIPTTRSFSDCAQDLTPSCSGQKETQESQDSVLSFGARFLLSRLNTILDAPPNDSQRVSGISKITDHLFLGSADDYENHAIHYKRLGITHVVSVVEGEMHRLPRLGAGVRKLGFNCTPRPYDMRRVAPQVIDFYDEGVKDFGERMKMIIHCKTGGNRGGFLAVILVAKELRVDVTEAACRVFETRPIVLRRSVFREQLVKWTLGDTSPMEEIDKSKIADCARDFR